LDRTSLADLLRQVDEVKPDNKKPDSLMYYI
jgi:hypothetical protein